MANGSHAINGGLPGIPTDRDIPLLVGLGAVLLLIGCDPMYTTVQPVSLLVKEARTGRAIPEATVETAAHYYEGWHSGDPSASEDEKPKAWLDRFGQRGRATDSQGKTTIELRIHTVCGGLFPGVFPGFDARADRVTGVSYLFRVEKGEECEIVSGTMIPRARFLGQEFVVEVISIGQPKRAPPSR